MISYAQNREDVVLDRLFPRGVPGFYIDAGAYDPTYNSVTRHFYDLGWRGINVEPAKAPFERLAAMRERDVNLNSGLSDEEGSLTFFECPPESGWSTFDAEQAKSHTEAGIAFVERTVPVTTLARICEDHVEGTIDFLTVDVEGHEAKVLQGADWKRWRPRVVLVEATEPGTKIPSHDAWESILLDADYQFVTFDGLNRYYVRAEDSDLIEPLRAPANVLDDYIPYEFAKQMEESRGRAETALHDLAATRALNHALRTESAAFNTQLAFLQAEYARLDDRYRNLESAFLAGKAQYEAVRSLINEVRGRYEQLRNEMAALQVQAGEAREMLEGVAPAGLAVARRLTRLSERFPQTASMAKKSARRALDLRRRVRRPEG
ncbi:MAG TPA: FkbM family methyltransferase [Acidimicrobiales bacterium]|nr:FkbM family methyltransferase [Acidimicrobiales bacterium]